MQLSDRVVVVTGAASGIGRALAERAAAEGARGVVAVDRDAAGARSVAARIRMAGGDALGLTANVTIEAEIAGVVERAEREFGPVDLFCANAGIALGLGPETADEEWQAIWDVNVMAHVRAARVLLPGWLARGDGYFLATASAAGLLSQIGSAPYAVTKHAAVAFAEWLALTYGDRGVRVSCLCPQGVRTPMLLDGIGSAGAAAVTSSGDVLEPEEVAAAVVAGLHAEQFLILPHPEVLRYYRRKAEDYDRWITGMQRLQARLLEQTDPGP